MKEVLVDTSVLIDFLRQPNKHDTFLVRLIKAEYQLCIAMITHTELYAGKKVWEDKKMYEELQILFSGLHVLPFTNRISEQAGKIKAHHHTDLIDSIIAATALCTNIPLATRNEKDFRPITHLQLLPFETVPTSENLSD